MSYPRTERRRRTLQALHTAFAVGMSQARCGISCALDTVRYKADFRRVQANDRWLLEYAWKELGLEPLSDEEYDFVTLRNGGKP